MLKGKTTSGFEFEIKDEAFDNWELLEALADVDNGHYSATVRVTRQLLDKAQLDRLKEHCRDKETGRVSKNKMFAEIADILKGAGTDDEKEKNV